MAEATPGHRPGKYVTYVGVSSDQGWIANPMMQQTATIEVKICIAQAACCLQWPFFVDETLAFIICVNLCNPCLRRSGYAQAGVAKNNYFNPVLKFPVSDPARLSRGHQHNK
jgi:hypothetical protein